MTCLWSVRQTVLFLVYLEIVSGTDHVRCRVKRSPEADDIAASAQTDRLSLNVQLLDDAETQGIKFDLHKQGADLNQVPVMIGKSLEYWMDSDIQDFSVYADSSGNVTIMRTTSRFGKEDSYIGIFQTPDGKEYTLQPSGIPQKPSEHRTLKTNLGDILSGDNIKPHRVKRQAAQGEQGDDVDENPPGGENPPREQTGEVSDEYIAALLNTSDSKVTVTDFEGRQSHAPSSPFELDMRDLDKSAGPGQSVQYVIELLIAVDFPIYMKWFEMTKGTNETFRQNTALRNIYQYYTYVAYGIGLRYSNIRSAELSIEVKLTGIYIATSPADSPWSEAAKVSDPDSGVIFTHSDTTLDKFEEWLEQNKDILPSCDLGALFTGYVPYTRGRDKSRIPLSGLADIRGVCTERRGSLNHDRGLYGAIQTATHEIGHNLGSFHDGTYNDCNRTDHFIMTPFPSLQEGHLRLNQFLFSTCSLVSFRDWLRYLQILKTNCLTSDGGHSFNNTEFKRRLRIPPGQFYDLDIQCQAIHGMESFYCRGHTNDKTVCSRLTCYNPLEGRCLWSRAVERAVDGTTCGNKKWCDKGECAENTRAPAAKDSCLTGDMRGTVDYNFTCDDVGSSQRHLCYRSHFYDACCQTCQNIKDTDRPDCPYGDKSDWCRTDIVPSDCYHGDTQGTCCQRCKSWRRPNARGCEFGDRAKWCTNIPSYQCYQATNTCCESCGQLQTGTSGCEYGNKVGWCEQIHESRCYIDKDRDQCCEMCSRAYKPILGCEYGDHGPQCTLLDCKDSELWSHCCWTCRDFHSSHITLSTTTAQSTRVTPGGHPYEATTVNSVTTMASSECVDRDSSCIQLQPHECYHHNQKCCKTCHLLKTNIPECPYGDREVWCVFLIQSDADCLSNPGDNHTCCGSCRQMLTPQTSQTEVPSTMKANQDVTDFTTQVPTSSGSVGDHTTWATLWNAVLTTLTIVYMGTSDEEDTVQSQPAPKTYGNTKRTQGMTQTTYVPPTLTEEKYVVVSDEDTANSDKTSHKDAGEVLPTTSSSDQGHIYLSSTYLASTTEAQQFQTTSQDTATTDPPTTRTESTPHPKHPLHFAIISKENECEHDEWQYCQYIPAYLCYDSSYRKPCCKTCQRLSTGKGGCQFGDRVGNCPHSSDPTLDCDDSRVRENCCTSCLEKRMIQSCHGDVSDVCPRLENRHCYHTDQQRICCRTCQQKHVPVLGCEFGDKASWCPNLAPWYCYSAGTRDICCHTCHIYKLRIRDCEWGDRTKRSTCANLPAYKCYHSYYSRLCCGTCWMIQQSMQKDGCMYGDRKPGCTQSSCRDPTTRLNCCQTCKDTT